MYSGLLVLATALTCQQAPNADQAALARINQARKGTGLAPVTLDPALSKGCIAHAHYVARNLDHPTTKRIGVNEEDPKLPGYSEEGRKVARPAFVILGDGPLAATEWVLSTFYARTFLLHPDLKRIGIGSARDKKNTAHTVLDLERGRFHDKPIYYPGDQQKDVPLAFVGPEAPDPVPKEEGKQPGFPITIAFPPHFLVKKVTATLKDGDDKDVEFWLSSPEKPAFKPEYQRNTASLIAKDWLQADTTYTVTLTAEVDSKAWKHTWSFKTGDKIKLTRSADTQALDVLNTYRKQAGLEPVVLDPDLSKGCAAHAQYLIKNIEAVAARKINGNDEDPKLPGYTVEGQRAARVSYLETQEPAALMDSWMAMLFKRMILLDPDLKRIGIGQAKSERVDCLCVLDVNRSRGNDPVALYPLARQNSVPLTHGDERPNPIPDSKDRPAGYPVTAIFPEGKLVTNVSATLKDPSGKEVPAWLTTPEKPAIKPNFQRNAVCLFPKEPLKPNTTYTVTVKATWSDEAWTQTWSFTTGKKR